jgi:hypothetical protein
MTENREESKRDKFSLNGKQSSQEQTISHTNESQLIVANEKSPEEDHIKISDNQDSDEKDSEQLEIYFS